MQEKKDQVELEISDNGIGIPKDFDKNQTDSLGINLITMLSEKQLGGKLKVDLENGTSFKLNFTKKNF